jgi:hypothetical protein
MTNRNSKRTVEDCSASRFHPYSVGDVEKPNPRVKTRKCAGCPVPIFPREETRKTVKGLMHETCARKYICEQLKICGLPKPTSFEPFRIKAFLKKQFSQISEKEFKTNEKPNQGVQLQLSVIKELSNFITSPIDTSKHGPHNVVTIE